MRVQLLHVCTHVRTYVYKSHQRSNDSQPALDLLVPVRVRVCAEEKIRPDSRTTVRSLCLNCAALFNEYSFVKLGVSDIRVDEFVIFSVIMKRRRRSSRDGSNSRRRRKRSNLTSISTKIRSSYSSLIRTRERERERTHPSSSRISARRQHSIRNDHFLPCTLTFLRVYKSPLLSLSPSICMDTLLPR